TRDQGPGTGKHRRPDPCPSLPVRIESPLGVRRSAFALSLCPPSPVPGPGVLMHCPFCQHSDTRVIDSRVSEDGATIRRRRECEACGERFSTLETIELKLPAII